MNASVIFIYFVKEATPAQPGDLSTSTAFPFSYLHAYFHYHSLYFPIYCISSSKAAPNLFAANFCPSSVTMVMMIRPFVYLCLVNECLENKKKVLTEHYHG